MFIILTSQRSGSHLLNSLLNSHPDLTTYGEIMNNGLKILEELGDNEGAIIHYNQLKQKTDAKIIHLIRNDLEKVARSRMVSLEWRNELGTQAHYKEEKTIKHPEIPQERVDKVKQDIKKQRNKVMQELWDADMFYLSYEMLTEDDNLEVLSKKRATPILNFLGVEPMKLTTNFKKPKYGIQR